MDEIEHKNIIKLIYKQEALVILLPDSYEAASDSDEPEDEDDAVDDHDGHHELPGAPLAEVRVGVPSGQLGSCRACLDAGPVLDHLDMLLESTG